MKTIIQTTDAPAAIGTYSQGIKAGGLIFISGQIPINPKDGSIPDAIDAQIRQVLENLQAMCIAATATIDDIAKITVFMVDLNHFGMVNTIMSEYFCLPYPARAAVEITGLPQGVQIEMDAIIAP